jgi:hypothetical protein
VQFFPCRAAKRAVGGIVDVPVPFWSVGCALSSAWGLATRIAEWFFLRLWSISSRNPRPKLLPPLTTQERVRLAQLVRTIERGLSTFLEVAKCLQEIRSSRLYREHHADFQSWCRETLGLARSSVDSLIRSGEVAQLLLDNGVPLPPNTTEAVIRPLASLPVALQPVGWQLVEAASPKCGPTQPVVAKVCRTIKNAIEPECSGGNGHTRAAGLIRHASLPSSRRSNDCPPTKVSMRAS